jgi:hypothetical protein
MCCLLRLCWQTYPVLEQITNVVVREMLKARWVEEERNFKSKRYQLDMIKYKKQRDARLRKARAQKMAIAADRFRVAAQVGQALASSSSLSSSPSSSRAPSSSSFV